MTSPETGSAPDDWRKRAAEVMTTEHFTLQSARSATIADASGRANLYLASVSATLVALAFVGQASGMGTAFSVFGLVLFPTLFFLGLATSVRVAQSSAEDLLYAMGINRIRHFYLEYVPEAAPYFILSAHDDSAAVLSNMAVRPGRRQLFLTTAGTIGVINSVVGAVAVGLAADLLGGSLRVAVGISAAVFALSVVAHYRAEQAAVAQGIGDLVARFPSPPASGGDDAEPRATATAARG